MFKDFKRKSNKINYTTLAKSNFCWVQNVSEIAKKQPQKFQTMYFGIVCQENGITLEELKTLREPKDDIDKEIEELESLARAGRYSLLVQIAEVLVKVMQSPFTDDAMFQRAEELEKIRKKILGENMEKIAIAYVQNVEVTEEAIDLKTFMEENAPNEFSFELESEEGYGNSNYRTHCQYNRKYFSSVNNRDNTCCYLIANYGFIKS